MEATDADATYLHGMAAHEAGHAVVAWSLNLRVDSILLREQGARNSETKTGRSDHLALIDQLAVLTAGKVAERILKSPLPDYAGDRDSEMAINLVLEHHKGASSDEIECHLTAGHVRARAQLAENQDRAIRLAARLFEVHEVGAAEFLRLMTA